MAFDRKPITLAIGTYERLFVIKRMLAVAKNRTVTFDEAVEYLLDYRDTKRPIVEAHISGVITKEAG